VDKGRITAIHNVIYGSDYMEEVREQLHAALDELVQERTDLLAALEMLLAWHVLPDEEYLETWPPDPVGRAHAAIAKAKGES
jgi:hypothetical protein